MSKLNRIIPLLFFIGISGTAFAEEDTVGRDHNITEVDVVTITDSFEGIPDATNWGIKKAVQESEQKSEERFQDIEQKSDSYFILGILIPIVFFLSFPILKGWFKKKIKMRW